MAQPPQQPWNPGRAAGNTMIVILTLVGLFCVLPVLVCGVIGVISAISNGH